MAEFAIAVGSNRGDRAAQIAAAATLLTSQGDIVLLRQSPLLATAPVGGPGGQDDFLNGAWVVATNLGPHQLLHRLQRIEHALGRTRTVMWGPRTIDLDLILARAGDIVHSGVLTLPHPRLHERCFVLQPLALIAGTWQHPLLGRTVAELFAELCAETRR